MPKINQTTWIVALSTINSAVENALAARQLEEQSLEENSRK